jgi:hypothetical protein
MVFFSKNWKKKEGLWISYPRSFRVSMPDEKIAAIEV